MGSENQEEFAEEPKIELEPDESRCLLCGGPLEGIVICDACLSKPACDDCGRSLADTSIKREEKWDRARFDDERDSRFRCPRCHALYCLGKVVAKIAEVQVRVLLDREIEISV